MFLCFCEHKNIVKNLPIHCIKKKKKYNFFGPPSDLKKKKKKKNQAPLFAMKIIG